MVVILWLGNLKWNLRKHFVQNFKIAGKRKIPSHLEIYTQKSQNIFLNILPYLLLGNWVMKWLLIFVFDTANAMIQIGYLDGLPKTYFRKVEFNCKVQLSKMAAITWCAICTTCPYVWAKRRRSTPTLNRKSEREKPCMIWEWEQRSSPNVHVMGMAQAFKDIFVK